jgi:hypothetical protein
LSSTAAVRSASIRLSSPKNETHPDATRNLTRWKPGQSGNPKGAPRRAQVDSLTILRMGLSACNDLLGPGESIQLSDGVMSGVGPVVVEKDAAGVLHYLVNGKPGLPNTTHEPVNPDRGEHPDGVGFEEFRVLLPHRARRGAA